MKNVKILHTADVHIGAAESFLGTLSEERRYETVLTFERTVAAAKENGADILLIAGDLFDSNRTDERFIELTFAAVASVPNIKTVFCAGNHDPLSAESPFITHTLPENLYVLGKEDDCITFEDLKVKIYGRSFESVYMKGEEKFTLEPSPDYINIMLQHGDLKSDMNSDYNAITPKFVKTCGMDYIALGHVHKKTDIGKIDSTCFAYCGCPEGQGFDETDEKGVYIGEIGKGVCNLRFVPVAKRKHIVTETDISDCESDSEACEKILSDLSEKYGDGFRENLYKIKLTGAIGADREFSVAEIKARLSEQLYFVKLSDCTEASFDLEELSKEISLKGIFAKKMLAKYEKANESEKEFLNYAVKIGLKAFSSEVKYDED